MNNPRTFIIAEAGVNHNGSLDTAKKLIDAAARSGADAVKFQTFKANKLASFAAPKADYQKHLTSDCESQYEMLKKLELTPEDHHILMGYCEARKIRFLSSPFDTDSVDLLAYTLGLPLLKIPSGEITNAPLILHMAKTNCPVILSTGMATIDEVEAALGVLAFGYTQNTDRPSESGFQRSFKSLEGQAALKEKVSLMHCTTEYPAPVEEVNLLAIQTLKKAFGLPVGYSDHTDGIVIPIAAVAIGATIVEKHFTLDKLMPGPDHKASLEPEQFAEMVASIRQVEGAVGDGLKVPVPSEIKNIAIARKSLVAAKAIKQEETFTAENLTVKRPGTGISPMNYWDWLGKRATRDYQADEEVEL